MSRFTAETVFLGLVRAWRLAIRPTRGSPLAVKATMDGAGRAPSWLGLSLGGPAVGIVPFDARGLQEREQLAPCQLDPFAQRVIARRRLQRAVEVVQRGHQALEDRGRRVRRGLLPVPLHALPVVLELRPLAQDL